MKNYNSVSLFFRDFLLFSGFLINCSQLPMKLIISFVIPEDIKESYTHIMVDIRSNFTASI